MGECINLRRGGDRKKLPVLNPNYPADFSGMRSNGYYDCIVEIAEHGNPAEYTYQWFINGTPYSGATHGGFSYGLMNPAGTYSIYCEVTNAKGTVRSRTATITLRESYLYNWGDIPANSGGWTLSSALQAGVGSGVQGAFTIVSNALTLTLPYVADATRDGYIVTGKKINLTNYSKIRFEVSQQTSNASYLFKVGATTENHHAYSYVAAQVEVPNSSATQTIDVDVSGLNGEYYIGGWGHVYDENALLHINKVQLIL